VSHIIIEGRKYMWDGVTYPGEQEAEKAKKEYEEKGFDVKMVNQEGEVTVYTRKEVEEIVLEGPPP
ncbi:MAG: hypothetical protein KAW09_08400, partial [Thermoplasmata archaeon]|nr:hypothetical protein [Thermoplasmata archaeon]